MIYPKVLEELIESFKTLPGIGDKSAERMALTILKQSQDLHLKLRFGSSRHGAVVNKSD